MALCMRCYGVGRIIKITYFRDRDAERKELLCEDCHGSGVVYCCDHAGSAQPKMPSDWYSATYGDTA